MALLEVKNLQKSFDGNDVLKNISFSVQKGEVIVILGPSGCGKSTLLRCINGLETVQGGEIVLDGEVISNRTKDMHLIRQKVGMVFQSYDLFPHMNVLNNILLGPLKAQKRDKAEVAQEAEAWLERVGLPDKKYAYPRQLSGGQKQRVGIARALASDPKVLLCDEATSALDPQTTKSILELIKDINRKLALTVVVITHEMQVIKDICDKVAVISNGVIAEEGSVVDVFTNPQQEITKEFISVLLSNELPVAFRGNEISMYETPGSLLLLRLVFLGETADDPALARMIRAVPSVECTMLFGNLDQIHGIPFGRMIVGLSGEKSSTDAAIDFLQHQDLKLEVIGYVARRQLLDA